MNDITNIQDLMKLPDQKLEATAGREYWSESDERKQEFEVEQGERDGQKWATDAHPNMLRFFVRYFEFKKWKKIAAISGSPLRGQVVKTLPDFKARGADYTQAFAAKVDQEWSRVKAAWGHLNYLRGLEDGDTWARETASSEELHRLETAEKEGDDWRSFPDGNWLDPGWTLAHELFGILSADSKHWAISRDHTPPDWPEFSCFWKQLVPEPLCDIRCIIFNPEYALGFADGALGVKDRVESKFFSLKRSFAALAPDIEQSETDR